jgi:hypothetical protein
MNNSSCQRGHPRWLIDPGGPRPDGTGHLLVRARSACRREPRVLGRARAVTPGTMNPQIDARSRRWLLEEPNGGFESHLTTAPAGSSPSALGSPQDPETGQRFERSGDHCWWFAGDLLATGVAAGPQEGVCAGGRDRDRTCDFCRVKTSTAVRQPATMLRSGLRPWRLRSLRVGL